MASESTERARASAWRSWESWCRLHGYDPMGQSQALAEYLEWIGDPLGGGLSVASANLAYWAVRLARKQAGWHDAEKDPVTRSALIVLRGIQTGTSSPRPPHAARRFTRDELVSLTEAIESGSLEAELHQRSTLTSCRLEARRWVGGN
ncbi:MAG: hypothetical protein ACYC0I_10090 [Acidimicrobiales bacterium]